MKQITPEIKARVFALYWNQMRLYNDEINLRHVDISYVIVHPNRLEGSYLLLKPLSSITDEDAIELNTMHNWTKGVHGTKHWYQDEADYLRSKGYALPAFGYSVDELVGAGVFKIREVNNDN